MANIIITEYALGLTEEPELILCDIGNIVNTVTVGETTQGIDDIYQAGEIIGGHKVVYVLSGQIYKASGSNISQAGKILGITTGAVLENENGTVRKSGKLNGFTGLEPGTLYYLDTLGALTIIKPTTGLLQCMGCSIDADNFEIKIHEPIILG